MNQELIDLDNNFKTILEKISEKYKFIETKLSNISDREEHLNKEKLEITRKESDIEDFKKVSIMSSMSKQIKERDKKIALLEKQLNKYKQKVIDMTKKEKENIKEKKEVNIEKDWENLSKEIYNLENIIYDTYNESKSVIPVELLSKGYQIYNDERNHNNRYWIKDNTDTNICEKDNNEQLSDGNKEDKSLEEDSNETYEEEEEVLYEEEIDGTIYFVSESIPKIIYEKLKNEDVGNKLGNIDIEGNVLWDKKI